MATTNLQTEYANVEITRQFTNIDNVAELKISSPSSSTVGTEDADVKSADDADDTTMHRSEFFLHRSSFSDEVEGMTALGCGKHYGMNTQTTQLTDSAAVTVLGTEKTTPITSGELEVMKTMYELLSQAGDEVAHTTEDTVEYIDEFQPEQIAVENAVFSDVDVAAKTKKEEIPLETVVIGCRVGPADLALSSTAETEKKEEKVCHDTDNVQVSEVLAEAEDLEPVVVFEVDKPAKEVHDTENVEKAAEVTVVDAPEEIEDKRVEAAVEEVLEPKSDEGENFIEEAIAVNESPNDGVVVAEVVADVLASVEDKSVVDDAIPETEIVEEFAAGDAIAIDECGDCESVVAQAAGEKIEAKRTDIVTSEEAQEAGTVQGFIGEIVFEEESDSAVVENKDVYEEIAEAITEVLEEVKTIDEAHKICGIVISSEVIAAVEPEAEQAGFTEPPVDDAEVKELATDSRLSNDVASNTPAVVASLAAGTLSVAHMRSTAENVENDLSQEVDVATIRANTVSSQEDSTEGFVQIDEKTEVETEQIVGDGASVVDESVADDAISEAELVVGNSADEATVVAEDVEIEVVAEPIDPIRDQPVVSEVVNDNEVTYEEDASRVTIEENATEVSAEVISEEVDHQIEEEAVKNVEVVQETSAATTPIEDIVATKTEVEQAEIDHHSIADAEVEGEQPVTNSKLSCNVALDLPVIVASLAAGSCVIAGALAGAQMISPTEKIESEEHVPSDEVVVEIFNDAAEISEGESPVADKVLGDPIAEDSVHDDGTVDEVAVDDNSERFVAEVVTNVVTSVVDDHVVSGDSHNFPEEMETETPGAFGVVEMNESTAKDNPPELVTEQELAKIDDIVIEEIEAEVSGTTGSDGTAREELVMKRVAKNDTFALGEEASAHPVVIADEIDPTEEIETVEGTLAPEEYELEVVVTEESTSAQGFPCAGATETVVASESEIEPSTIDQSQVVAVENPDIDLTSNGDVTSDMPAIVALLAACVTAGAVTAAQMSSAPHDNENEIVVASDESNAVTVVETFEDESSPIEKSEVAAVVAIDSVAENSVVAVEEDAKAGSESIVVEVVNSVIASVADERTVDDTIFEAEPVDKDADETTIAESDDVVASVLDSDVVETEALEEVAEALSTGAIVQVIPLVDVVSVSAEEKTEIVNADNITEAEVLPEEPSIEMSEVVPVATKRVLAEHPTMTAEEEPGTEAMLVESNDITSDMPQIVASLAIGACAATAAIHKTNGELEGATNSATAPAGKEIVLTDPEEEVIDEMIDATVEEVLSITSADEQRDSLSLEVDEADAMESANVDTLVREVAAKPTAEDEERTTAVEAVEPQEVGEAVGSSTEESSSAVEVVESTMEEVAAHQDAGLTEEAEELAEKSMVEEPVGADGENVVTDGESATASAETEAGEPSAELEETGQVEEVPKAPNSGGWFKNLLFRKKATPKTAPGPKLEEPKAIVLADDADSAAETAACIHVDVEDESSPVPEAASVAIDQERSVIPQDSELDQEPAMEKTAAIQAVATESTESTELTKQSKAQELPDSDSSNGTKPAAAEAVAEVDTPEVKAADGEEGAVVIEDAAVEPVKEDIPEIDPVVEEVAEEAEPEFVSDVAAPVKANSAEEVAIEAIKAVESTDVEETVEPAKADALNREVVEEAAETEAAIEKFTELEAVGVVENENTKDAVEDIQAHSVVAEAEPAIFVEVADDDTMEVTFHEKTVVDREFESDSIDERAVTVVAEVKTTEAVDFEKVAEPVSDETLDEVVETDPASEEIEEDVAREIKPLEKVIVVAESVEVTTPELEENVETEAGVVEGYQDIVTEVMSTEVDIETRTTTIEAEVTADSSVGTEVTCGEDNVIEVVEDATEFTEETEPATELPDQVYKEEETNDAATTEVATELMEDPNQVVQKVAEDLAADVELVDATHVTVETTAEETKPNEPSDSPAAREPSPIETVDVTDEKPETAESLATSETSPVEPEEDTEDTVKSTPAVQSVEVVEVVSGVVEATSEVASVEVGETAPTAVGVTEEELKSAESFTVSEIPTVKGVIGDSVAVEVADEAIALVESPAVSDVVVQNAAAVDATEKEVEQVESTSNAVVEYDDPGASGVFDEELAHVEPTPVVSSVLEDAAPVKEQFTPVTVASPPSNECVEKRNPKAEEFEVDTKPISAVSMLIGRFEQFAKRNAEEAANSRSSSRVSSRVSSPIPSPPSTFPRGNVFETAAKNIEAIEKTDNPMDEPIHVELIQEKDKTEVVTEEEACKFGETVDEAPASELTIEDEASDTRVEKEDDTAKIQEGTQEEACINGEVDKSAEASAVAEPETENAPAAKIETEAVTEETARVEKLAMDEAEVIETDQTITEEVDVEVAVDAESAAEPETEIIEATIKELVVETAEEVGIGLESTDAGEAVADKSVVEEVVKAAVETTRETQTSTTAYEAAEMSILSIDTQEDDVLRNSESDTSGPDTVTCKEADPVVEVVSEATVATADFTTSETVEAYFLVNEDIIPTEEPESDHHIERSPSDFASATKETHVALEESKESHDAGDSQKEEPKPTERRMSSISPDVPTVQINDAAVTNEATAKATVEMTPTSQATKAVADDATEAEITSERDSPKLLLHEHLTYEILGVTRANNVIMYHIYTINSATGERSMSIPKRYSEFKLLEEQLRALDLPTSHDLPELPKPSVASFLRGRRSKKTIEMREKAFGNFLRYITEHEELHKCAVFQQFIAN